MNFWLFMVFDLLGRIKDDLYPPGFRSPLHLGWPALPSSQWWSSFWSSISTENTQSSDWKVFRVSSSLKFWIFSVTAVKHWPTGLHGSHCPLMTHNSGPGTVVLCRTLCRARLRISRPVQLKCDEMKMKCKKITVIMTKISRLSIFLRYCLNVLKIPKKWSIRNVPVHL